MHRYNWRAEKYIPLLMTYGFTLHIIRVARYLQDGTADLSQIITIIAYFFSLKPRRLKRVDESAIAGDLQARLGQANLVD